MTLTLNLVTRGRPERALQIVKNTAPKIARDDTTYMISLDDDDQASLDIIDDFKAVDSRIFINVKPREDAIGDKYNRVLEVPNDVYMVQGDYRSPTCHGFDQRVIDAVSVFPDGIGGALTHMENASFSTSQALTHGLVEKLGYFYPSIYPYWFVDHHADDMLKLIGRVAFADVSYDGLKSPKPPTTDRREVPFWATFFDCQRIVRRRKAAEIINSPDFQEPEWRKKLLLAQYPLIEYRSQWINDLVREMFVTPDSHTSSGDGGERYRRVKEKALALMKELAPEVIAEMEIAA